MRRFALLPMITMMLSGCARHIIYCEGSNVTSPDGQCSAQLVQDVATKGSYASVDCKDWHYQPYVQDQNAIALNGAHTPLAVRWLGNHRLEVTLPPGASVRRFQPNIRGRSYTVQVSLRTKSPGDTPISGCGLDP